MVMKNLVVCVDGSPAGELAFHRALLMVRESGGRLDVVHVLSHNPSFPGEPPVRDSKAEEARRQEAQKMLDHLSKIAEEAKLYVHTRLLEGHVATELVKYAEESNADLLVVGHRGLSNMARFLLGSVSNAVVAQAKCSVLVVK
ncbi:MAG: universal stress protein [Euryarchaeota archaeon]|nr:universal stress protein [Euryarchaeota archaeon]